MKLNLLLNKMISIQEEYKVLLMELLPRLRISRLPEALDEINLFWIRHIDMVQLYLRATFAGNNSYVFTAVTYMDFEDKEHLPFLLMGEKHILDDPLSRYSGICNKMPDGRDAGLLYEQIKVTVEDNIRILEAVGSAILILPLRFLNQSGLPTFLAEIGEKAFVSLFDGIESLNDYFEKCSSIKDIMRYARKDIGNLVLFSENDDLSLPFEKRFEISLSETEYMMDTSKPDSYNFFMLVFGCVQQAIDVISSCVEYDCIPYIRYPVAMHYMSLLLESMLDVEHIVMLRYKMSVAFTVYCLCDKEQLAKVSLGEFLRINQEYDFSENLLCTLELHGINEKNFLSDKITRLVIDELEKFYIYLVGKSGSHDMFLGTV